MFILVIHQFCYYEVENFIFWPLNQFLNKFNASLYFHLAKSYVYQMGKSLECYEI